jgi:hypothetical protein
MLLSSPNPHSTPITVTQPIPIPSHNQQPNPTHQIKKKTPMPNRYQKNA